MKETERYLSSMLKHFDGKESEANWEAREQTITRLREFVQSTNTPEEKSSIARWIRSYGDGIGQSVRKKKKKTIKYFSFLHDRRKLFFFITRKTKLA